MCVCACVCVCVSQSKVAAVEYKKLGWARLSDDNSTTIQACALKQLNDQPHGNPTKGKQQKKTLSFIIAKIHCSRQAAHFTRRVTQLPRPTLTLVSQGGSHTCPTHPSPCILHKEGHTVAPPNPHPRVTRRVTHLPHPPLTLHITQGGSHRCPAHPSPSYHGEGLVTGEVRSPWNQCHCLFASIDQISIFLALVRTGALWVTMVTGALVHVG